MTRFVPGYFLLHRKSNDQNSTAWLPQYIAQSSFSGSVRVDGLRPATWYDFSVQVFNDRGYGPISPVIRFQTPNSKSESL